MLGHHTQVRVIDIESDKVKKVFDGFESRGSRHGSHQTARNCATFSRTASIYLPGPAS